MDKQTRAPLAKETALFSYFLKEEQRHIIIPTPPTIRVIINNKKKTGTVLFPFEVSDFKVGDVVKSFCLNVTNDPATINAYGGVSLGYFWVKVISTSAKVISQSPLSIETESKNISFSLGQPCKHVEDITVFDKVIDYNELMTGLGNFSMIIQDFHFDCKDNSERLLVCLGIQYEGIKTVGCLLALDPKSKYSPCGYLEEVEVNSIDSLLDFMRRKEVEINNGAYPFIDRSTLCSIGTKK